jgi:hypothetical protein
VKRHSAELRGEGVGVARPVLDVVVVVVEGSRWEAPVGFCDPWPYGWGFLGQQSFFRFFVVTFRAADWELKVEPAPV